MISYNGSNVIQSLRQYEMFANSLRLVKSREEKNMIIKQLTKLELKIIEQTNEVYEEEYYTLYNRECGLLEDEKKRITMLIDLINQRLSYVEKRCNDHYQLTGESLDTSDVLGADTLDNLENRVKIIDKYTKNIKLQAELKNEVKSLSNKISLAEEKIDINKNLNIELESKFKELFSTTFEKLGLYQLLQEKDDIEYAYYETEKSLTLAELNLETAKTSPLNILYDCEEMLREVKADYVKYKDKLSILKLMELFNKEVNTYDELLVKRKQVNDLFKYIKNNDLIQAVMDTISKQYNTIMMEQQDVNTYNDLKAEKERKLEALAEIEDENESEEFQKVLKVLIENEKKKQEKILEEQRRVEEAEKKKRMEFERKKQEEILKRQKIIEEARKKEIEKRTKQMLEQQQKSVLQPKKKDTEFSFETIKDNSINKDTTIEKEDTRLEKTEDEKISLLDKINILDSEKNDLKDEKVTLEEEVKETPIFKDKSDIEKELFNEFNSSKNENDLKQPIFEEKMDEEEFFKRDNKLPDISIDEYMKNFNEKTVDNSDSLFGNDDIFPSIPM